MNVIAMYLIYILMVLKICLAKQIVFLCVEQINLVFLVVSFDLFLFLSYNLGDAFQVGWWFQA